MKYFSVIKLKFKDPKRPQKYWPLWPPRSLEVVSRNFCSEFQTLWKYPYPWIKLIFWWWRSQNEKLFSLSLLILSTWRLLHFEQHYFLCPFFCLEGCFTLSPHPSQTQLSQLCACWEAEKEHRGPHSLLRDSQCWKMNQYVAFQFSILAFSTNFCPSFRFSKLAKIDHFWHI